LPTKTKFLSVIILCALAIRLLYLFCFVDLKNDNYSEYGYIAENIKNDKGFSLFYFQNDSLKQSFNENTLPYPSAFMPPLYVFYILPAFYLDGIENKNIIITISQILLSLFVIYFMFKLTDLLFGYKTAITASLILLLIPEYTYITSVHNSVVIYHLLILMMLFFAVKTDFRKSFKGLIVFSTLSCMLVYTRSEFFLFYVLVLSYLIYKKDLKTALISFIIFLVCLSPWIIRNGIVFDKFIPFTTSSGLNLYRGNNPLKIGSWGENEFIDEIRRLSAGENFEIVYDDYYEEKAISFITDNPEQVLSNSFRKVFKLWVFDADNSNSMNFVYLIPSILIIVFSILGIIKSWNKNRFLLFYLLLISTTISSVIFFPLPRHQIMMKIILIPFCAFYVNQIISIFVISKRNTIKML